MSLPEPAGSTVFAGADPVTPSPRDADDLNPPAASVRGLRKVFRRTVALDSVDLDVPTGSVLGLLGPNGSGKTTMLRLLLGLSRPTEGGVRLLGEPMPHRSSAALRQVGALVEGPGFHRHLSGRANLTRCAVAEPLLRTPDVPAAVREALHRILLLPLAVRVAAADALAGEASSGTLRMLLLAPIGRLRVVAVKALGVLALAVAGVLVIAAVGWLVGMLVVGGDGRLLTLSGSAIDAGDACGRVWLAAGWTVLQLAAVGAIALAVSAFTDRPLVVIATVLGGAIVFGVLLAIPSLGWLHPLLLTSAWPALADLLRDPIPTENLTHGALLAMFYLVLGLAMAVTGTLRREV